MQVFDLKAVAGMGYYAVIKMQYDVQNLERSPYATSFAVFSCAIHFSLLCFYTPHQSMEQASRA